MSVTRGAASYTEFSNDAGTHFTAQFFGKPDEAIEDAWVWIREKAAEHKARHIFIREVPYHDGYRVSCRFTLPVEEKQVQSFGEMQVRT